MPTTLTGLLLFLTLLLPGFTFLWVYTFDRPARPMTVLQETGAVVMVSIATELMALTLLFGVRAVAPRLGIDPRRLAADPGGYLQAEYGLIAVSFIASLVTACTLAAVSGMLARRKAVHPSVASSWWTLFEHWHPGTIRYIQCELDNGSSVAGVLGDWNTMPDDSPDRDLILNAPITFRPGPDSDYQTHPVSTVCVSARRIVAMFVAYSDPPPTSFPPSVAEAVAGSSVAAPEVVGSARSPNLDRQPSGGSVQVSAHGYDRSRRSPSGSSMPRDRVRDRRGSFVVRS